MLDLTSRWRERLARFFKGRRLQGVLQTFSRCNGLPTPFIVTVTSSNGSVLVTFQIETTENMNVYTERSIDGGPWTARWWSGVGPSTNPPYVFTIPADTTAPDGRICYRLRADTGAGVVGCFTEPVCVENCGGIAVPYDVQSQLFSVPGSIDANIRLRWTCDVSGLSGFRVVAAFPSGGIQASPDLNTVQPIAQVAVPPGAVGPTLIEYWDNGVPVPGRCYAIEALDGNGNGGCRSDWHCSQFAIQ